MPFGVGFPELIVLLVVLLLVFGAKRLPEMGRSLGKGMREFKEGVSGVDTNVDASTQPGPAELPAQTTAAYSGAVQEGKPDAVRVREELESLSEDERRAILDSLTDPERPSAPESERETVS